MGLLGKLFAKPRADRLVGEAVRLATSADAIFSFSDSSRYREAQKKMDDTWRAIAQFDNRPVVVDSLMGRLRKDPAVTDASFVSRLCKFLGECADDHARRSLLEILERARRGADSFAVRRACEGLWAFPDAGASLRSSATGEVFSFVVMTLLSDSIRDIRDAMVAQFTDAECKQLLATFAAGLLSKDSARGETPHFYEAIAAFGLRGVETFVSTMRSAGSFKCSESVVPAPQVATVDLCKVIDVISGIPGVVEKLRSLCSKDEFRSLLNQSRESSAFANADFEKALLDVADDDTIKYLVGRVFIPNSSVENRRELKEAMIAAGKRIHSGLLRALQVKANPLSYQVFMQRELLDILSVTGDRDCLLTIAKVGEHSSVNEIANEAMLAIAQREGVTVVPIAVQRQLKTIRSPQPTGDSYVDACFGFDFQEEDESRDWYDIKELKHIRSLLNAGKAGELLPLIVAALHEHPDFDVLYMWLGEIHERLGNAHESAAVMREGLQKCRRKAWLCNSLGDLAFSAGDLATAVRWWITSCAAQLSGGCAEEGSPFVNLAYVAEGLALGAANAHLLHQADRIDSRQIRYGGDRANQNYRLASSQGNPSIGSAIKLLCDFYLG